LKRGNIASYEKQIAQPSIDSVIKMADFFGVELNTFLKEDLSHGEMDLTEDQITSTPFITEIKTKIMKLLGDDENLKEIVHLKDQNLTIKKMVDGFREYHGFRMRQEVGKHGDDWLKLAHDYEKLLELLEVVLESNTDLLDLFDE
jgi:transcriptional regulator with XRE-family HTH domain